MQVEKLKYSLLRDSSDTQNLWSRSEKRQWFLTLIFGTCMLYSTRTTMPLLIPAVAKEQKWSKTDCVIGGYVSDRFGGQKVILLAALGWSLITFWMPSIIYAGPKYFKNNSISFIVTIRILNGAFQGVHFPSMISLTSQFLWVVNIRFSDGNSPHWNSRILCPGLLRMVNGISSNRTLGLSGTLILRYYTMSVNRNRVINVFNPSRMCTTKGGPDMEPVPWLKLFTRLSFWACVLTHACEMNCFFVLLSWLPTYFHDGFPQAKGWVVNMIPWLALPPCTFFAKYLSSYLISKEYSITTVRKLIQSLCFLSQNIALFCLSRTNSFQTALICMTVIIGGSGFHNNAVTVNPQDLAPNHSGSVFGLMNTVGAIPGFLGVYLAGHILELTQSWPVVFSTAAGINLVGWIVFVVFGSSEPIHKRRLFYLQNRGFIKLYK
uniref:Major facilitator superfamily (MFS) profile domain-containing protein n=1 Tax=Megaselia scalaris TaxID=36166 RepID=T1GFU5_MEGSC